MARFLMTMTVRPIKAGRALRLPAPGWIGTATYAVSQTANANSSEAIFAEWGCRFRGCSVMTSRLLTLDFAL